MTYWKAARPDGTDFYTGKVDYAAALSGEPLPVLPGKGPFPGPGWYHLATVPTECVGMEWPCRLFEVEPADDLGDGRPSHRNKVGAKSVRVLREVPAHMTLGPQGAHVAALIARAGGLDQGDASRLAAARNAARNAAWYAAWDAARKATWKAAWDAARNAATGQLPLALGNAARDAAGDAAWVAAWDAAWSAAGAAAGEAAWSAAGATAWALVVRDLIGTHYDTLTGPWRTAIGPIHPGDGDSDV